VRSTPPAPIGRGSALTEEARPAQARRGVRLDGHRRRWTESAGVPRGAALVLISVLCAGCGVALRSLRPSTPPEGALAISDAEVLRCARSVSGAESPYRRALPGPETDPELLAYLHALPPEVRRTAVAAGIEPLLARTLRAHAQSGGAPTLDSLSLRQALDERLAALSPQMLATEFECECQIALLAEVITAHDDRESERQLALTIASLVAGAGFSLAAGAWDLANEHLAPPVATDGPLVTALVGAAVTTGLGAAVMVPVPREIFVEHAQNLLAPILNGEDPERLYPTFVFRMLTTPEVDGSPSPRARLLERWQARIGDAAGPGERAALEALLAGSGGVYDARAARLRQALLEDLEAALDALARHVDRLGTVVGDALGSAADPATGHAGDAE
jgi:hypothetical protein